MGCIALKDVSSHETCSVCGEWRILFCLKELHRARRALGEWIIFEVEEMDVMFFNKRSARLALQPGQGTVNPQRLEI